MRSKEYGLTSVGRFQRSDARTSFLNPVHCVCYLELIDRVTGQTCKVGAGYGPKIMRSKMEKEWSGSNDQRIGCREGREGNEEGKENAVGNG